MRAWASAEPEPRRAATIHWRVGFSGADSDLADGELGATAARPFLFNLPATFSGCYNQRLFRLVSEAIRCSYETFQLLK